MATSRVSITIQDQSSFPETGVVLNQQNSNGAGGGGLGNRAANPDGKILVIARNTNAAARTVTFSYVRRGVVVTQGAVNMPAQQDIAVFGPFPREMGDHVSADAADGDVYFTASGADGDVKFAAVRMPNQTHATT